MRHCKVCDQFLPLDSFYKAYGEIKSRKCRDCTRRLDREKRAGSRPPGRPAKVNVIDEKPKHDPYRLLTCRHCGEAKVAMDNFALKPNGAVRYGYWCHPCIKVVRRDNLTARKNRVPETSEAKEARLLDEMLGMIDGML